VTVSDFNSAGLPGAAEPRQIHHAERSASDGKPKHAFIGEVSFHDHPEDRQIFVGRNAEAKSLFDHVMSSRLVLVCGPAGAGKTSLINANLLPLLRADDFFPIVVRMDDLTRRHDQAGREGGLVSADGLMQAIIDRCRTHAGEVNLRVEEDFGPARGPRLWSFLRCTRFYPPEEHTAETAPDEEEPLRVVLILDRFEQLFRLLEAVDVQKFAGQLGEVVANRVPAEITRNAALMLSQQGPRSRSAGGATEGPRGEQSGPDRRVLALLAAGRGDVDANVVIVLREDYLRQLESLKSCIPTIGRTTFRLQQLSRDQARAAIEKPPRRIAEPFTIESAAVGAILSFLVHQGEEDTSGILGGDFIQPMELQILCRGLERERPRKRDAIAAPEFRAIDRLRLTLEDCYWRVLSRVQHIDARRPGRSTIRLADLGGDKRMRRILEGHYWSILRRFPRLKAGPNVRGWRQPAADNWLVFHRPRYAVAQLFERHLITGSVQRNILGELTITRRHAVPAVQLDELVEAGLLARFMRSGRSLYELAYDTLVPTLVRIRRHRQARRMQAAVAVAALATVAVVGNAFFLEMLPRKAIASDVGWGGSAVAQWMARAGIVNLSAAQFKNGRFSRLDLSRAQADQAVFDSAVIPPGAKFDYAGLGKSSFFAATIPHASFKNATLVKADFRDAKIGYADFEGADIRDVDITNATRGCIKLKNSNWWLMFGLNDGQRLLLRAQYPPADYTATAAYKSALKQRFDETKNLPEPVDRASASNTYVWFKLVSADELTGDDITMIDGVIKTAKDTLAVLPGVDAQQLTPAIIKPIADETTTRMRGDAPFWSRVYLEALDTRAQIHLKSGTENEKAVMLYTELIASSPPEHNPGWEYRYAMALSRVNDPKAEQVRKQAEERSYRPTYEAIVLEAPGAVPQTSVTAVFNCGAKGSG
jgi:hypothetical protein